EARSAADGSGDGSRADRPQEAEGPAFTSARLLGPGSHPGGNPLSDLESAGQNTLTSRNDDRIVAAVDFS
ncbi:hypothetical protein, partial [Pseudonocardia sp. TMWB2A]|uniref:hypothetical protein n=1 Tax=Pseudonocardia sp. TMWB2A TaxID=687430 RepID=UPI00307CD35C